MSKISSDKKFFILFLIPSYFFYCNFLFKTSIANNHMITYGKKILPKKKFCIIITSLIFLRDLLSF